MRTRSVPEVVSKYVQERLRRELAPRGAAERLAATTGYSTAHIANVKNHGTVGHTFAEAMAGVWGMTWEQLKLAASGEISPPPAPVALDARAVILDDRYPEHARRLRHYRDAGRISPEEYAELMRDAALHEGDFTEDETVALIRSYKAERARLLAKLDSDETKPDDPAIKAMRPRKNAKK